MKRTALILFLAACAGTQTPDPEAVTDAAANVAPEPAPEVAPAVDPVPEGFHTLTPVLIVDDIPGAVEFYTKALGAEHRYTTNGPDGKPMIAQIKIGDSIVMLSPENEERRQRSPRAMEGSNGSLHVYVEDVDAVFAGAVEAGATERMALADMWWGDRFGELLDPFGHRWSLATHQEKVAPEVMKERAEAYSTAMAEGKEYTWEKGEAAASYKPDGYWTVTPALVVAGGPEAADFYKDALGGEILTAMPMPEGGLMHAELKIGDSMLMMSGEMPADGPMGELAAHAKTAASLGGASVQVMVYTPDTDAALAKATGAGAKQVVEAMDMFWGDRYGVVLDPSGTPWAVATHIKDVKPEEMKAAMMEQMGAKAHAEGEAAEGEAAKEGEATKEGEAAEEGEAAKEGEAHE